MPRLIVHLLIALLTFIISVTVFAVWSSLQPAAPPSAPAQQSETASVAISDVEFYGWWRDQEPSVTRAKLRAHDDGDEAGAMPSYTYHHLDAWDVSDKSQPSRVDVVCRVQNNGRRPVDLMLLAQGEFSISPEGAEAGSKELLRNPTILTEQQNIGQQVVRGLAPGEIREVKFTDFDLKGFADKYVRKTYGPLRPWEFRADIDVRTLDNKQVAQQRGTLQFVRMY